MTDLHLLGHKLSFPTYQPTTAWLKHGPFAMWIVRAAKPKMVVELGTHFGYSYFSFCEAVKDAEIATSCFAVDTWQGDEHAGFYDKTVMESVERENRKYINFSRLLRKTFSEALRDIEDSSIDILHIDGRHRYEDVKDDFESWQGKLSKSAIVLFHDTEVVRPDFGVKRYWSELQKTHDTFNFEFQNGLGVLFWGDEHNADIKKLRKSCQDQLFCQLLNNLFLQYSDLNILRSKNFSINEKYEKLRRKTEASAQKISEEMLQQQRLHELMINMNNQPKSELSKARSGSFPKLKNYTQYKAIKLVLKTGLIKNPRTKSRLQRSALKRNPKPSLADYNQAFDSTNIIESSEEKEKGRAQNLSPLSTQAFSAVNKSRLLGYSETLRDFKSLSENLRKSECGVKEMTEATFLLRNNVPSRQGPVCMPGLIRANELPPEDVVIYTSLFGNYDTLPIPFVDKKGYDFVCFTDQDIEVPGWRMERKEPTQANANLSAKLYKLKPHDFFPDHKFSLFVDANTLFLGRIDELVNRWLKPYNFAMWRHPDRDDIFDEAEAVILLSKDDPETISKQMAVYEEAGVLRNAGLYECSFIWRSHFDTKVSGLMNLWWNEVVTHSKRDQTSFYFLAHHIGPKPHVLPNCLGNSRDNCYFSKLPHKSRQFFPLKRLEKPRVAFAYDIESESSGSTLMRSIQLPQLLKDRVSDEAEVIFTSDLSSLKNQLVIVGKRLIDKLSMEDLDRLKKNNAYVVADPVDSVVSSETVSQFDALLSASLKGYYHAETSGLHTHNFLITHHADPRITVGSNPTDALRTGYFGELSNTIGVEELNHLIDYHMVSTNQPSTHWLAELSRYNAHFAVRKFREIDGHKPFTKGFVAAKSKSVIICERNVGDNTYYLGDDYPFYAPSLDFKDLERHIYYVNHEFGSATWNYAMKIMKDIEHRSSEEWITNEFKQFINEIW